MNYLPKEKNSGRKIRKQIKKKNTHKKSLFCTVKALVNSIYLTSTNGRLYWSYPISFQNQNSDSGIPIKSLTSSKVKKILRKTKEKIMLEKSRESAVRFGQSLEELKIVSIKQGLREKHYFIPKTTE